MNDVAEALNFAGLKSAGLIQDTYDNFIGGKWVGPVKTPLTGEITACNDRVESDATILNKSPYKEGWIVRIKPSDLEGEQGELVSGDEALEGFKAYMKEKELGECIHCEGFDG